jgi:hypothetical protein
MKSAGTLFASQCKTLSSCLQICLARQWDMPTTSRHKDSIKKQNSPKSGDFMLALRAGFSFKALGASTNFKNYESHQLN